MGPGLICSGGSFPDNERSDLVIDTGAVKARIENAFPALSPQLKRAARYVLDAPDDVALNSMRTVASHAGVHPSTMVRLAKELEFSGYAKFREPFRQRLRTHTDRYADRARHLQAREADRTGHERDDLLVEIQAAGRENLSRTFAATSAADLAELAEMLEDARRIFVVGMRKCHPVAYYLHYACRMFHDNVVLANGIASTMADELRDMRDGDVLIAVSFEPYTRETVRAARHALSSGAKLVAITDSTVSPLAEGAAKSFVVANDSPSFFRSVVAAMALAEAFVAFLVAHGGNAAIERLTRTEMHLENFDAYWTPDSAADQDDSQRKAAAS